MADTRLQMLGKIGSGRNPIEETEYQNLVKQGGSPDASGFSGGGFDMGGFLKGQQDRQDALLAKQTADTSARFAQGKTDVGNFMGRYNAAVPGLYDTTEAKYNVPFWRTTANAIGNRIDELRGNTNNAGAGGYASADQVDKSINTNFLPRFAQATNTANTASGLAQSEFGAKIAPFETESKLLTDRLSRESTGYNQGQQRELDSLISQIQSGTTLNSAAMQRATALAEQENQKLIAEEGYAAKIKETQIQNQKLRRIGTNEAGYIDAFGNIITVGNQPGSTDKIGGNATPGGNNGSADYYGSPQMSAPEGTRQGNYIMTGGKWYPITQ